MFVRCLSLLALVLLFTSCAGARDGTVVAKRSRRGLANFYASWETFTYNEPDVYWVRIQGKDENGRLKFRDVILWRKDWEQLRVGDRWDAQHGFSPGPGGK